MLFILSKIFSAVVQPLFWLSLWWIAALLLLKRHRRLAVGMLWTGLGLLGLLGFPAIPDLLLRPLENRYTAPGPADISKYTGVIVLGGVVGDPLIYLAHGQIPLGESAERLTESSRLIRTYPNLRLVFSGGEGLLVNKRGVSESDLAGRFYAERGLDMTRIQLESHSRNTRENAQRAAELIGSGCKAPWLLMTSAFHMPRAMAEFEAAGCHVTPYPVDYLTGASRPWTDFSIIESLGLWQTALHEYVGMAVYQLTRHA